MHEANTAAVFIIGNCKSFEYDSSNAKIDGGF